MDNFTHSGLYAGSNAAHIHLIDGDTMIGQLTLDYPYDSFYFKFMNEPWIIISYGQKGDKNELDKINTCEKRNMFDRLRKFAAKTIDDKDSVVQNALYHLSNICFVY